MALFLVMTNNGPWEHDMVGVVGAVPSMNTAHLKDFAQTHDSSVIKSDSELKFVSGPTACQEILDENELSWFCDGTVRLCLSINDSLFYFTVEME